MTKKDLFRIIIKLFGLYVTVNTLMMVPQMILGAFYQHDMMSIFTAILVLSVIFGLIFLLIFKTDLIINLFRLEQGYDDESISSIKFEENSILKLGIIIISLFFVVDSLPYVITNLFYIFKNSIAQINIDPLDEIINNVSYTRVNYLLLIISSIKLILGFLMLMNKQNLSNLIQKIK